METEPLIVETELHVRYAETDAMGIVHHAEYVAWFEEGRSAWFRERLGNPRGYALLEEEGYFLVVTDVNARFVAPARYGDRVRVRTWISAVRSRGIAVSYRISNAEDGHTLCRGQTTHVCLDRQGQVVAIPAHWAARFLG